MNRNDEDYRYAVYPLEREGIKLHLDCMWMDREKPEKSILLIHGSTFSSHEFDIDYKDYSLVRRLVREGYAVWRLDIAGYGQSGDVADGYQIDTAYAAEDIGAAVDRILEVTEKDKIDLLGWSWGTMTACRFAVSNSERLNRLVLYAPILSGLGQQDVPEPFRRITWETAIEDMQRTPDGEVNPEIMDPEFVGMWCSSCWRYDRDRSPRGWLLDAGADPSVSLIDLESVSVPTLVICGDKDQYLDYRRVHSSVEHLPDGSELKLIPGGSHIVFYEKPHYRVFQESVVRFLKNR